VKAAQPVHPFTAGAILLTAIALALLLITPESTAALLAATCVIAAVTGTGRGVKLGLAATAPIWVLLFIVQGVFAEGPRVAAPWGGTLSHEGLIRMVSQGTRLSTIAVASLAWATWFSPHRFLQAAIARRWPFGAAFLVVATLDAADRLRDQARCLREAQRTRGIRVAGSVTVRARAFPALVFPLLLSVLTEADDRALALETRGLTISGPRTSTDPPPDRWSERCLRWLLLLGVLTLATWRVLR
jgi:energy-coupling factor transport system permease protein